jgi:hypothetical protein
VGIGLTLVDELIVVICECLCWVVIHVSNARAKLPDTIETRPLPIANEATRQFADTRLFVCPWERRHLMMQASASRQDLDSRRQ